MGRPMIGPPCSTHNMYVGITYVGQTEPPSYWPKQTWCRVKQVIYISLHILFKN